MCSRNSIRKSYVYVTTLLGTFTCMFMFILIFLSSIFSVQDSYSSVSVVRSRFEVRAQYFRDCRAFVASSNRRHGATTGATCSCLPLKQPEMLFSVISIGLLRLRNINPKPCMKFSFKSRSSELPNLYISQPQPKRGHQAMILFRQPLDPLLKALGSGWHLEALCLTYIYIYIYIYICVYICIYILILHYILYYI